MPGTARIGRDRGDRVGGPDHDRLGLAQGVEHLLGGRGRARRRANSTCSIGARRALDDHELLERPNVSAVGAHARAYRLVATSAARAAVTPIASTTAA